MLILKWTVIAIVVAIAMVLLAGQAGLFKGAAPADLGQHEGRLKAPSATDNSVSSQAALYPDNPQRQNAQIDAIQLHGDGPATLLKIKAVIETMPAAKVIVSEPDYLYVQFTSGLMKFVDDVEFWYDPATQVIQLRSASRVGRKDLGVNRARIEAVRSALN